MKKVIAVIFGGQSTEHDISIITALSSIIRPLTAENKYDVLPIYIAKNGKWYADKKLGDVSLYRNDGIDKFIQSAKPVSVEIGDGFAVVREGFRAQKQYIDIVFPAMHGMNGEDGALMGLLQMAKVPFVGCNMASSVIAMDKILCKQVISAAGIEVANAICFTSQRYSQERETILSDAKKLKLPLFVKPSHLGSSIGISKVDNYKDLENAIEVALHYDTSALIEEGVQNLIEVTLPIIGNESPQQALLERPLSDPDVFFDFETKYMNGGKKKGGSKGAQGYSELPAVLPKDLYEKAEKLALQAYIAIGCNGIARVDMLIDSVAEKVYFNEINPLPGSLYAHNWQKAGVSPVALVNKLIDLAVERHKSSNKNEQVFTTSFLKQF